MRFFRVEQDCAAGYSGAVRATHRWGLPGVICPACRVTWSDHAKGYPSVDLTSVRTLADFETPRPEPLEEYERLCEMVRPLVPPGALLTPGTTFGPLQGTAHGRFGALFSTFGGSLLVHREALEKLQAEGLQGLKGCPTALSFRQRQPPPLLELELPPVGHIHPTCFPTPRPKPCPRCQRKGLSLPDSPQLDATSLSAHLDIFRLADFSGLIFCSERFADACKHLGLDGVTLLPFPVR